MNRTMILLTYAGAYLALSLTDIGSTLLALSSGEGQEFNPKMATEDGVSLVKFALLNGAMLLVSGFGLHWALKHIDEVDPGHIRFPLQSMWSWLMLNPFSARNRPKTIFHALAMAPALLCAKLIATVNNLLLAFGVMSPLTPLAWQMIELAGGNMIAGYWLTIFVVFTPLTGLVCYGLALALRPRLSLGGARAA